MIQLFKAAASAVCDTELLADPLWVVPLILTVPIEVVRVDMGVLYVPIELAAVWTRIVLVAGPFLVR